MLITIIALQLEALSLLPQAHSVIRMSRASERKFSRVYEDRCRAPKIRREAKKRSSLKFGPIFCPKLGAGLNTPLDAIPKLNAAT